MDFKNSPKKVRRVSAISQKNRDQVSKNKTIQTFNNKVTLAERADLVEKAITSHTKKMFFSRFENLSNVRKIVISWICVCRFGII